MSGDVKRQWWWATPALLPLAVGMCVAASTAHVRVASRDHIFSPDDVPHRDVGMVLGARAYPDRPSTFLAARLKLGIKLYEAGKVDRLLVSGDGLARSNYETTVMRKYLAERGIPAADILEDPGGLDTYDSCIRARDVYGLGGFTAISQGLHVPRAVTIGRHLGLDVVGVGDHTMEYLRPETYRKGELRELAANLKMEWDLMTRRQPVMGPA